MFIDLISRSKLFNLRMHNIFWLSSSFCYNLIRSNSCSRYTGHYPGSHRLDLHPTCNRLRDECAAEHYPCSLCSSSKRISIVQIQPLLVIAVAAILRMFEIAQPIIDERAISRHRRKKKLRLHLEAAPRLGNTMSLNDPWQWVTVSETKWKKGKWMHQRPLLRIGIRDAAMAVRAPWSRVIVISRSILSLSFSLSLASPATRYKVGIVSHNRGESPRVEDAIDFSPSRFKPPLPSYNPMLQQVWLIWILCGTNDRLLLSHVAPRDNVPRRCTGIAMIYM